ncbi:hypothetical protein HanXRQr2_Chr06g0247321 [Helianthus annuus]|uniref:Uncharacterized protein n=1 Tax=Helianthus annuus TaxID=4232 RepID=A0A251UH63_HELAN|nr:hypothetical protein HanXRQr2_Chr06g0247321 [Helianthus annuus]KAJ0559683.1 hypothetical protein HanHA300_Chr06g0203111 [Helianthus annuus]KAJ0565748.1 hypothetical protein HanIR_Chr06g0266071 [Helianthus annuus]KAJ0572658.1 hypothetical protein HanHA89_Chr06g0218141 [Helianthus annuus]KAJ0737103.1 hypothetical protein HanLR1_Chr06g0203261 [Helianthus annuus]
MAVEVGFDNPVPIYQLHVRFLTTEWFATTTVTTCGGGELQPPNNGGLWWWLYTFGRQNRLVLKWSKKSLISKITGT